MHSYSWRTIVTATAFLLIGSAAHAATLYVNCGGRAGLTSISAAIKDLQGSSSGGPNAINVTGACHENLSIQNMDLLTISGTKGASITDISGGALDVIDIRNSKVTITGMTVDGLNGVNNDAVDCEQQSQCLLIGNTIQGAADAVGVYFASSALVIGGVLQNTTSTGIFAPGDVAAYGVLIQGTPVGIVVQRGGRARAGVADPASTPLPTPVAAVISGNGAGVRVLEGAQFNCTGCVIRDNGGDGVYVDVSAAASIGQAFLMNGSSLPYSIIRNAGVGVNVGDLASASFHGPAGVSGNGQPDIGCNSPTSVTRGALNAAGGPAHTNCTN